MIACWHTSLQMDTHNQNDWSVATQKEYTELSQDFFILSLFVGNYYRKGPALSIRVR